MNGSDASRPPEGGELWLERNLPVLRAFIRLRMGPALSARESSSDLLQSVCRELLQHRVDVEARGEPAMRAWLYTAALHKIQEKARFHRAQKRDVGREEAPSTDDDGELLSCYGHVVTPSRDLAAREQVARMEAAFQKLSEREREIITLARVAGLSHAEIATQLAIGEDNCRQILRRGLVKLSGLLEQGEA